MTILTPLKVNQSKQKTSASAAMPPPVGGWNERDALSGMSPQDATILENWFPETTNVRLRRGHTSHVTGITGAVETLMEYSSPSTDKLFAAANSAIYDVSSSGSVGSAVVSSLSNNRFQHTNFGDATNNNLVICNGEDDPRQYNGSAWSTPSVTGTGLTAANLTHVNDFKERLFFVEKNSLNFWYNGTVNAVAGTYSKFNLSSLCKLGGYLQAMGTWSRDGGSGMDDYAVFITSQGEVLIYDGTNPASADTWSLIGIYRIAPPIGRRCLTKLGADLVVITTDGYMPLSQVIGTDRTVQKFSLSDKITGAVTSEARAYGSIYGWQPIVYAKGSMFIVNVPHTANDVIVQHVMNLTTGAWCKFTNMNANCWAVFKDELYFGGDTKVYKADTGTDDDGSNIEADGRTSYQDFPPQGQLKSFKMVRPILLSDSDITPAVAIQVDYETKDATVSASSSTTSGAAWDSASWDISSWADRAQMSRTWKVVTGQGYVAALRIKVATKIAEIRWAENHFVYQPGGLM